MNNYYVNTLYDKISSLATNRIISKEYLSQLIPKNINSGVYEIVWDTSSYPIRLHRIRIEDFTVDGDLEKSDYIKLHYKFDGHHTVNDRVMTKAQLIKFDISKYRMEKIDEVLS